MLNDHNYCTTTSNGEIDLFDQLQTKQLDNVMPLSSEIESWYRGNVVLDHAEVIALEAETRGQSHDSLWFCERKRESQHLWQKLWLAVKKMHHLKSWCRR